MRFPLRKSAGSGRHPRRFSIRTLLVVLAVVPSLALVGLWGFTAQFLYQKTSSLKDQNTIATNAGMPAYAVMVQLQDERRLSAAWIAAPGDSVKSELSAARLRTDRALGEFTGLITGLADTDADVLDKAREITTHRDRLPANRASVDERGGTRAVLLTPYTRAIETMLATFAALSHIDEDGHLTYRAETLVDMFRATEMIAREDALLTYAAGIRKLGPDEYLEFAEAVGARRTLYDEEIVPNLEPEFRTAFQVLAASQPWKAMLATEAAVLGSVVRGNSIGAPSLPSDIATWRPTLDQVGQQLATFNTQRAGAIVASSQERVDDLELTVWLISALGLAVVVVVSLLCWAIARSLRRRLLGLRAATVELAENRLPDVINRLSRGEAVDAAAELPELPAGNDEIGQVAAAFGTASRAAIDGATRLAREREGHAKVFHNVALRTQSLVGRQLRALDAMENRHQDPEILDDLFLLDHLATRLRRYEENLVILSGHHPGRRWSKPVRVVDVVRSAVGEVEDYHRIDVHVGSDLALAGSAVGAVIHLLAELLENAATFSPPDTPVEVRGMAVAKGLVLEIEDRGLGMTEAEYTALNGELAHPAPFDMVALGDDVRLGIFVVAQLAQRYGISVTLRPSPYGGTLAIVFVPKELTVGRVDGGDGVEGEGAEGAVAEPADGLAVVDVAEVRMLATVAPRDVVDLDAAEHAEGAEDAADAGRVRSGAGERGVVAPGSGFARSSGPVSSAAPVAAGAGSVGEASAADVPGAGPRPLPRRVRQASLAAPLREAQAEPAADASTEPAAGPTPQQAAATISAFQRASERARAAELTTEPPMRDRP